MRPLLSGGAGGSTRLPRTLSETGRKNCVAENCNCWRTGSEQTSLSPHAPGENLGPAVSDLLHNLLIRSYLAYRGP